MDKKRPQKIKHYRRSFSGAGSHSSLIRTIISWVIVLLLLFGVGWLIAKPGLDFVSGLWYSHKNSTSQSESVPGGTAQSEPVSSQPESEPAGETPQPSTGSWAMVSLTSVATPETAAQTAATLAQQGVTAVVIPLKDETGAVYYASSVAMAKTAVAGAAIDAAGVAKAFTEAGITPVAGIWAFKDATAPYSDRSAAVKYQGTDYNWLDNSKELGGKPWLNPNSAAAQGYISDLITEVTALGFPKTLVFGLQFPTGYSLEACSYGAMTQSKSELLAAVGKQWEQIAGAEVWFCFDQDALTGANLAGYDASPASFGLAHVLVRGRSSSVTNTSGETLITPPATDAASLTSLLNSMTDAGTQTAGYYLFGFSTEETAAANQTAQSAGFAVSVLQF